MSDITVFNEYEKQANDFLEKNGVTFKAELLGYFPHFDDDKESRDVYQITLTRGDKVYSFRFGQSIACSATKEKQDKLKSEYYNIKDRYKIRESIKAPTAYDVLTAVQKYDVGTFSDFCSEFGYDSDSRKAEKIYFAVQEEYGNINRLFSDVLEELQDIVKT